MVKIWFMIQKILITVFIFFIFIFGIRFFKKIKSFGNNSKVKETDENIVDLEKDPKTNEYKPKE